MTQPNCIHLDLALARLCTDFPLQDYHTGENNTAATTAKDSTIDEVTCCPSLSDFAKFWSYLLLLPRQVASTVIMCGDDIESPVKEGGDEGCTASPGALQANNSLDLACTTISTLVGVGGCGWV